jgi:hypothetical protein
MGGGVAMPLVLLFNTQTKAQFFKQKYSRASRQVCWPGAEQAENSPNLVTLVRTDIYVN